MLFSERAKIILEVSSAFDKKAEPNVESGYDIILNAANQFAKLAAGKACPTCVFPANHPKVKDDQDHYPLTTEKQAQKALDQVKKLKKVPEWFLGTLPSLVSTVTKKVQSKYKNLK